MATDALLFTQVRPAVTFISPSRRVFPLGSVHGAEQLKTPTPNLRITAHRIHLLGDPPHVRDRSRYKSRSTLTDLLSYNPKQGETSKSARLVFALKPFGL